MDYRTENLILHFVTKNDLIEVARTWPSDHHPLTYETIAFTLTCSEETLKYRHDRRGDKGETNYYWLHLPPCPGDIVIDTDNKSIRETVREMKKQIFLCGK